MTQIMLDIETLGLRPNSVILSVGAVAFEINREKPIFIDETLWVPGIRQQVALGRTIDKGTQDWWVDKEAAVRAHWELPEKSCGVNDMLDGLTAFIGNPKTSVWAHGPVFDITALQDLYRQRDREFPWRYDSIRDARTIQREIPACRLVPELKGFIKHHPVWDCKAQIWELWQRLPLPALPTTGPTGE